MPRRKQRGVTAVIGAGQLDFTGMHPVCEPVPGTKYVRVTSPELDWVQDIDIDLQPDVVLVTITPSDPGRAGYTLRVFRDGGMQVSG